MNHWWIVHRFVQESWIVLGAFHSDWELVLQTVPRYAEVVDVAVTVNPRQRTRLVVEEDGQFIYWVVHGTVGNWSGILMTYSTYKESFVVPI